MGGGGTGPFERESGNKRVRSKMRGKKRGKPKEEEWILAAKMVDRANRMKEKELELR